MIVECRRSRLIFVMPALITIPVALGTWRNGISFGALLLPGVFWAASLARHVSAGADYEEDARFLLGRFEDTLRPFESPAAASTPPGSTCGPTGRG